MPRVPSGLMLIYPLFLGLLFSAPLMRGLFFPADLLPYIVAAGAALLMVSGRILVRRERVFRGILPFGFLALAAAYGLSFFPAASKAEALRGFLRYLMYFAVFFVSAYLARERKGRRAITLTLYFSATAVALIGLSSATGVFVFPGAAQGARIMSTLQYPNALAAYLMFSSIIGLTLASVERRWALRAVFSVATSCQVLVFLASYSRGGWVIFPVALAVAFFGMPRAQRARFAYHACTILTAVLLVVRRFCESAEGETPRAALLYVLFGLGIALCFDVGFSVFRSVSENMLTHAVRRVLTWAGGIYGAVTVIAYLIFLAAQYSGGMAGLVSQSMLRRLSTISFDDSSLLTRAFASQDALRLFLDHPIVGSGAGGWNAFYHQYQTVLYWTTEVHNHYAQVLVETGILGFAAYVAIWGILIVSVARIMSRARRRGLMEHSRGAALIWGLFAACLSIGIHSAMDFELSLPGIALQLWAAFGLIYESIMGPLRQAGPEGPVRRDKAMPAIGLAILSVGLIVPPYLLIRGASYGSLGAAALFRQDFHTSVKAYQMARKFDPLTASYSMDMGQAYAAMALLEGQESHRERALHELAVARKLEPYNLSHRQKEVEVLVSLGEAGKALDLSREIVEGVPLDMKAYESFARLLVVNCITTESDELLDEVVTLPDQLFELQNKVVGLYREKWDPLKLEPSSSLNTYIGQAYYLRGQLDIALTYFDRAIAKDKSAEAQMWKRATQIVLGQIPQTGTSPDVLQIVSYFHPDGG